MKVQGIALPLSQSCRDLNLHLGETKSVAGRSRTRVGLRCGMNKTEAEFAMILEEMKRKGEIVRYEFEGVTLRFANVKYTPDFIVLEVAKRFSVIRNDMSFAGGFDVKFIEVKGPFTKGNRERAVERFRHAKTYWPEFTFEMWQKKDGAWTQII